MSGAPSSGEPPAVRPSHETQPPALSHKGGDRRANFSFSKQQVILAISIAAVSDAVCAFVVFAPPLVWAVDLVTAVLLFAVLGWQWLLLPGLVMEAIPGLGVIPFWLLVVGAILVWGTARPKLN